MIGRMQPNSKPLKELTDEEIFDILSKNETQDLHVLAGVCSEVLRRQLQNQLSDYKKWPSYKNGLPITTIWILAPEQDDD